MLNINPTTAVLLLSEFVELKPKLLEAFEKGNIPRVD